MSVRDAFLNSIMLANGKPCMTIEEFKEAQFGVPLRHYAQQYLYGCTGLRFGVLYSISGPPQSCKSPFVFDLMFDICRDETCGGPGGIAFLYELESKCSPSLLISMAKYHGQEIGKGTPFQIVADRSLQGACEHVSKVVLAKMRMCKPADLPPVFIDWDSIGGAASDDIADKIDKEGFVGKGFGDKPHIMKNFCENWSAMTKFLPVIFMAVNQEKADLQTMPGYSGPPKKHITGGESQVFKAGHIVSARYKTVITGDAKIVDLRTTKTSFCDSRRVEVKFVWNRAGSLDDRMAQGHHWDWALASAVVLANPAFVGSLRDIADVKVSDKGLVTCPQLDCKSVPAEEFEKALFDPANKKVLDDLYAYQKIEKLKGIEEFRKFRQESLDAEKEAAKQVREQSRFARELRKAALAQAEKEKEEKKQERLRKAEARKVSVDNGAT